ncbi:glycosyltransferase [Vibrio astriarenae]
MYISFVVVCYDNPLEVKKTLSSIENNMACEVIVVDGSCSQAIVNVVEKSSAYNIKLISESDNGIYDAMNKGIRESNGQYVAFINSGDKLSISPNVLISDINTAKSSDILLYSMIYDTGELYHSTFNSRMNFRNTIHHQGALFNRSVFENELYDCNFSILADYDFNLMLHKRKASFKSFDRVLSCCEDFGVSRSKLLPVFLESCKVRYKRLSFISSLINSFLFGAALLGRKVKTMVRGSNV